jgi:hypothetical protein
VKGQTGINAPVICGVNDGLHSKYKYWRENKNSKISTGKVILLFSVYVEMGFADSDMVTIDIDLANEESAAKFNILVSQIPCTASYRYKTHMCSFYLPG